MNTQTASSLIVSGTPLLWLRVEGAVLLLASIVLYAQLGGSGLLFIALLFVPDVSALGYLVNARVGAHVYNIAHALVIPVILAVGAVIFSLPDLLLVGIIWLAHIGLDRMAGYGLKYPSAFGDTHLGRKGRGQGRAR